MASSLYVLTLEPSPTALSVLIIQNELRNIDAGQIILYIDNEAR